MRDRKGPPAALLAEQLAQVEESLAHLSKLQESILDCAGEGIYGTDSDGCITFVNPAAARLLGWLPEELIGKPGHEILHHKRLDGSPYPVEECPVQDAISNNREHRLEEEVLWRKDGTPLPISLTCSPISDDGNVVGAVIVFSDITERKEAREQLEKSERELREAQKVAKLGSWSWDVTTDEIVWSDELFRIYDVDPEHFDPSYAAYLQRIHPEDRAMAHAVISKALAERTPFQFDHRLIRRDESVTWVQGRGRVLEKEGGGLCMVGTALDITERKEAALKVKRSEERYRGIFENAVEGIYQSSLDGRLLAVNPAGAHILGYGSPEEAITEINNLRHLYLDPARRDELIYRLARDGSVTGYEAQIRRADGEVIWVQLNVRVVGKPSDPDALMEGMLLDVTGRKVAEEYLRQSDERTKAIFASSPDSIITLDRDGYILEVNPATTVAFGVGLDEVIGKKISDLLATQDGHPLSLSDLVGAGTRPLVSRREAVGLRRDGAAFPVDLSISRAELGGDVMFTAHVRDISAQKREQQITEELESQLAHMQKMDALGQLAAGIAHDFNNLLSVIQNYAAFIRDQLDPRDAIRQDVEQVLQAAKRAATLTRQLSTFSRPEKRPPQILDLNVVVSDMEQLLRRTIRPPIHVTADLASPLWKVKADVGQLEQVIMNLALNARDAMPDGGRLSLTTSNVMLDDDFCRSNPAVDPGPYVRLRVADTGCGIPVEVRYRVFEPFFTSKEKGKGTGLGLATTYGIVTRSNGCITLDSEEGVGTRFDVYLPAVSEEAELGAETQASPRDEEAAPGIS